MTFTLPYETHEPTHPPMPAWQGPACYIAGPMRGVPRFNFPAFYEAEEKMQGMGWRVFNPARHDQETGTVRPTDPGYETGDLTGLPNFDLQDALRWDIARITESDAIVLLPGWETSKGVAIELDLARKIGLEVIVYEKLETTEPYDDFDDPLRIRPDAKRDRAMEVVDAAIRCLPEFQDLQANWPEAGPKHREDEVRTVDPETGGEKGTKLARFDLIPPDALWMVATHFGKGAEKYADRNWERGYAWSLSIAALERHLQAFKGGQEYDFETGSLHITAVAWHALVLTSFYLRGLGGDDRSRVWADD